MNIMGYISAILIIFSIISSYMFKQHIDSSETIKSINGYYVADRNVNNANEESLYICQKKEYPKNKEPSTAQNTSDDDEDDDEEEISPSSPNKQNDKKIEKDDVHIKHKKIFACSCINIFPLASKGKAEENHTYNFLAAFLDFMYGKELLSEKLEYKIIDELTSYIKKRIDKEEEVSLEKVKFKDPKLQIIWHKMLKGTKYYSLENRAGYLSILEFINIDKAPNNNKICISTAPKEILIPLFNNKIADKLWDKREKNVININKEDLEKILTETRPPLKNQTNIWSTIELSHSPHDKQPKMIIAEDEKTKISIRKSTSVQ